MSRYAITITPDEETEEYQVTLVGPGLGGTGRQFTFRNTERAENFEHAINFAYRQGLRDAARWERNSREPLWVVSGTVPDNLVLCREGFCTRLRRRLRGFIRIAGD
jgi:hypothetical protein